jgi:hypothetical protein
MTDDTRAYLKATLAKMGVTDHVEVYLTDRTPDQLSYMAARILPNHDVCVYSNGDAEADTLGYTHPTHEGFSMVTLNTCNFMVLCHELSHVMDESRNTTDAHDEVFTTQMKELLEEV